MTYVFPFIGSIAKEATWRLTSEKFVTNPKNSVGLVGGTGRGGRAGAGGGAAPIWILGKLPRLMISKHPGACSNFGASFIGGGIFGNVIVEHVSLVDILEK